MRRAAREPGRPAMLSAALLLCCLGLALRPALAKNATANDTYSFFRGLADIEVSNIFVTEDLELSGDLWPPLTLTRASNLTITGLPNVTAVPGPNGTTATVRPIVDFSWVTQKIRLLPGVSLTFVNVFLFDFRQKLGNSFDFLGHSPGALTRFINCTFNNVACPDSSSTAMAVSFQPRPPAAPSLPPPVPRLAGQPVSQLANVTRALTCFAGAGNASRPYCNNNVLNIFDFWVEIPANGTATDGSGGYLLQVMQCARHCDVIMSQQCIQQRGADRCYADAVFNARGLNNTGGNGTAGGGGTGSRPLPSVAGPPPPPAPALVVQDSSNDKDRLLLILLTTIVGSLVLVGLAAGAWLLYRRRRDPEDGIWLRKARVPKAGKRHCVVVTDIQDSTAAWEMLDAALMDGVMRLHDEQLRLATRRHAGHFSHTEGDSAILAFHSAEDAVLFACELQARLLAAPWPEELLNHPLCTPIWVRPNAAAGSGNLAAGDAHMSLPTTALGATASEAGEPAGATGHRSSAPWWRLFGRTPTSPSPESPTTTVAAVEDLAPPHSPDGTPKAGAHQKSVAWTAPGPDQGSRSVVAPGGAAASPSVIELKVGGPSAMDLKASRSMTASSFAEELHGLPQGASLLEHLQNAWRPSLPGAASARTSSRQDSATALARSHTGGSGATHEQQQHQHQHHQHVPLVCVVRGLRVRVGLTWTALTEQCVQTNGTTRRVQICGEALAVGKAVCDAAQGGMTLMSHGCFSELINPSASAAAADDHDGPQSQASALAAAVRQQQAQLPVILHMGDFRPPAGSPLVCLGDAAGVLPLYQPVPNGLLGRLPHLGAVRSMEQVSDGVLDAPVGGVITILFMHVVGHATLMAWNAPLATQATEMWAAHATKLLAAHSGYMVELAEGLLLAAFGFAHDAVAFALTVRDTMIGLEWPAELLEHELCEELAVAGDAMAAAAAGGLQARSGSLATVRTSASGDERLVLQRGPRLRVGIDSSPGARPLVNTTTGRMVYRGRLMNRAARLAARAPTSNVLCSEQVFQQVQQAAEDGDAAAASGLMMQSQGPAALKGVGTINVYSCSWKPAPVAFKARSWRGSMVSVTSANSSVVPQLIASHVGFDASDLAAMEAAAHSATAGSRVQSGNLMFSAMLPPTASNHSASAAGASSRPAAAPTAALCTVATQTEPMACAVCQAPMMVRVTASGARGASSGNLMMDSFSFRRRQLLPHESGSPEKMQAAAKHTPPAPAPLPVPANMVSDEAPGEIEGAA